MNCLKELEIERQEDIDSKQEEVEILFTNNKLTIKHKLVTYTAPIETWIERYALALTLMEENEHLQNAINDLRIGECWCTGIDGHTDACIQAMRTV